MKDYYKTLGITQNTEPTIIKAVYKALMMIYHPDRDQNNNNEAIKKSKDINEAYATLSDPVARKRYDSVYLPVTGNTINLYSQENQTLQNKIVEYQIQLRKLVANERKLQDQINEQKKIIKEFEQVEIKLNSNLLNCQHSLEKTKDYLINFKEQTTLIKIINEAENILDIL